MLRRHEAPGNCAPIAATGGTALTWSFLHRGARMRLPVSFGHVPPRFGTAIAATFAFACHLNSPSQVWRVVGSLRGGGLVGFQTYRRTSAGGLRVFTAKSSSSEPEVFFWSDDRQHWAYFPNGCSHPQNSSSPSSSSLSAAIGTDCRPGQFPYFSR